MPVPRETLHHRHQPHESNHLHHPSVSHHKHRSSPHRHHPSPNAHVLHTPPLSPAVHLLHPPIDYPIFSPAANLSPRMKLSIRIENPKGAIHPSYQIPLPFSHRSSASLVSPSSASASPTLQRRAKARSTNASVALLVHQTSLSSHHHRPPLQRKNRRPHLTPVIIAAEDLPATASPCLRHRRVQQPVTSVCEVVKARRRSRSRRLRDMAHSVRRGRGRGVPPGVYRVATGP